MGYLFRLFYSGRPFKHFSTKDKMTSVLIRDHLTSAVSQIVKNLVDKGILPAEVLDTPCQIDVPKDPTHGDFMTNFALVASKAAKTNPRALAESLAPALATLTTVFESVDIAGPGFINFRLNSAFTATFISTVNSDQSFYKPANQNPQKINVEHVSVNPNGPITIGSGRGAAFGSALCNVLEAAGNTVHREYYINDGVNSEQMRLFAESVKAIVEGRPVPDNGYKGDYVHEVAEQVKGKPVSDFRRESETLMIARQRADLAVFQTNFDTWFSEQSLHDSGKVQEEIDHLVKIGSADERPVRTKLVTAKGGVIKDVLIEDQNTPSDDDDTPTTTSEPTQSTLWLRSTKFGDDQDRVLRRADGRLTYIASDVAYHHDKFNRPTNAHKLITVLGPDHHGYIGRLTAVVAAMLLDDPEVLANTPSTHEPLSELEAKIYSSPAERDLCHAALSVAKKRLEVQIFQIVRFLKDGKPAPMRKRDGNIYALIDLINEIGETLKPSGTPEEKQQAGSDVARFFYLMRHHDTAMDFDLELATKQSDENPVFYVQYAHARICSILDKARSELPQTNAAPDLTLLTHEREKALIIKICDLPHEVARTAEDYAVNRLTTYATELARTYHHFYDACRVIQLESPALSQARLALCQATKVALASTLDLLGISTPTRM